MKDSDNTKEQLTEELKALRQRIVELEGAETEHRRAEEQTKQLQEYLRLQIERMPVALIVWDTEFRVQSWNPAAEEMFGFTAEEALGKHPYDLIVPRETQPYVDDIWRRLLEGDMTAHSINENITKDGRTITCEWTNTPLKKSSGVVVGVLSMVQDVTERRRAEERIRHLNTTLRALRAVNQLITRDKGREHLIQRSCELLVENRSYELAWLLLVDEDRNFVSAVHAGAEEKFSILVEQMKRGEYPHCVRAVLTQEQRFIACDDVRSQHEECVLVDCHLGGGGFASRLEYDGKVYGTISVDVSAELAVDEEEQELFQELVDDIAYILSRIEREEQLKQAEKKALEAEALREVDRLKKVLEAEALREVDRLRSQLLSNVSHELRTPLTSIKGFASTLLRTDVKWSEEKQRDYLQTIDRETDRLIRIISDLLDMSRLEAGALKLEKRNYQISEILDAISSQLASFTKHHQLQVIIPDELPSVFVDQMRIGQVLTNLVENAAKYSSEGSQITIEAQPADDQIIVSVTDRGQGIASELLDRVFDRFYQAESIVTGRKSGTGLGLSICKGIIESHGGRIWVESKLREGSKFSFSLPVSKGEEEIA